MEDKLYRLERKLLYKELQPLFEVLSSVRYAVVKGEVLSQQIYGVPDRRRSSDIDILIAEYNIMKSIMSAANLTTTIIVAHRLSTVRDADRIVVIDDGSIVEVGSHDELMSLRGKYFEMFTKQAENYVK